MWKNVLKHLTATGSATCDKKCITARFGYYIGYCCQVVSSLKCLGSYPILKRTNTTINYVEM